VSAVEDVRAAHQGFYDAFEARDLDAMSDVWEHSDRVTCTHPGWSVLRGWGAVAASWMALFQGPQRLQFILTDERIEIVGDVAWVTVDENILGEESGGTVSSLNVFVRDDPAAPDRRAWLMVAHHGSSVMPQR
jgi:ketosteroid isomerase-like protein